jgi:hypothetical protein
MGGWAGFIFAMMVCGLAMAMLGPPNRNEEEVPEISIEPVERARRGRNADPTRPTHEDWGGMMESFKRRP